MEYSVEQYSPALREQWDAFVRASRNGTFLFLRDYMDYLFMRYGKREFAVEVPDGDRQKPHIRKFTVLGEDTDAEH